MKKTIYLSFTLSLLCFFNTQAQTNYLWGSTASGGAYGFGTIVRGNPDGTGFQTVYSFDSVKGATPSGSMAQANNGKIYIVCQLGGDQGSCTVCKLDPTTNEVTKIYDFATVPDSGDIPYAGIVKAANGKLYGIASYGGHRGNGTIYMIDPATDAYYDVHDFDSTDASSRIDLLAASDGKLYGVSGIPYQNPNGKGSFFSFDPATNTYTKISTFAPTFGSYYHQSLIQASDGKIYGVYSNPYADSTVMFNYDVNTSTYTDMGLVFVGIMQGGFVDGGNGILYGVSESGILRYNLNTGLVYFFAYLDANTGLTPTRNPSIINGKLMFSTVDGGTYGQGALVSVDTATGAYTIMLSFDSATTGEYPECLVQEFSTTVSSVVAPTASVIDMYPNPAINNIYIENAEPGKPYVVTNLVGQELMRGTTTGGTQAINIAALPKGLYFLNQQKFVKE
ncbi:MAG TPA: choice-of-anchor tandem repeat GloVer-containing protein [Chitinophagales bacterium]|nr:choice-of-anchor tandem repeat GloVer-containing protein [Chitinophagales bacterium]